MIYHIRMDTIKCFGEKRETTQRQGKGLFIINEHILMNYDFITSPLIHHVEFL